jgi:hypothetical protein
LAKVPTGVSKGDLGGKILLRVGRPWGLIVTGLDELGIAFSDNDVY